MLAQLNANENNGSPKKGSMLQYRKRPATMSEDRKFISP